LREPPWAKGRNVLFISFNAIAELSCYLTLGWRLPEFILDLLYEHRQNTNGVLAKTHPRGLLAALGFYGLDGISGIEKTEWQTTILRGPPYSATERDGILSYCWSDIEATSKLLQVMQPKLPLNLDLALFRGHYSTAAATTLSHGISIDESTWKSFQEHRENIQHELVRDHPTYDEHCAFKLERFEQLLTELGVLSKWPRTAGTQQLCVSDKTFRTMSYIPVIEQLRQVRAVISELRAPSFSVHGGRNYFSLLPFKAETSRNASIGSIFQSPSWMRGFIRPEPGRALIAADYGQEELLIGGVLSGDQALLDAYAGDDPYVGFGIEAGLIPVGGSKLTHPAERAICKTCMLSVQYGSGAYTLSRKLGVSENRASDLLFAHRRVFRKFWEWSDTQAARGRWEGSLTSSLGWRLDTRHSKELTMRNFGIQSCGSDILRLSHMFLTEKGVKVNAPVHDSFLCECDERDLEETTKIVEREMVRASEIVLGGVHLKVESRGLRYPDRLIEPRGQIMWDRVTGILSKLLSPNLPVVQPPANLTSVL
jgi:hypothetical protein